jgi:hypothetical protein
MAYVHKPEMRSESVNIRVIKVTRVIYVKYATRPVKNIHISTCVDGPEEEEEAQRNML